MDSSFGLTKPVKSDVLRRDKSLGVVVEKDKESKNHPEVRQGTDDDSIFEAETQCDIDCLDTTKHSTNKLNVPCVSHSGKACVSEPDQEGDLFEAETQCDEPSQKVPVKSCGASDPKNQNLTLRSEIAVDDIYEAETQCALDDIPNEKIKVDVVSKDKLDSKGINSLEENVNICSSDQLCETDHLVPEDTDDSPNENYDEIYDAPTQCFPGNANKTTVMGKTDAVSICSERTEEYIRDDGSLNSHEDINNKESVDKKEDFTDSSILIERKGICSGNKVGKVPSSDKDGQEKVQPDSEGSSEVTKVALDFSCNEDSLDRSMLEGDDDLFTFEATQSIDSKQAAFKDNKTTKKFEEIYQEGSKSKSSNTNCNDTQTNLVSLSKKHTVKASKSEKTVSGCGASEKCSTDKFKSVQFTPKLSNESGDETDPDNIFEAKAQNGVPLNQNENAITKSSHHSSIESSSGTPIINSSSNSSKLCTQPCNDSGDETDPEDIFEAKTQVIIPVADNSKTISKHSEPSSSKVSSEASVTISSDSIKRTAQSLTDSWNADDQDRIFETQNQVEESQNKKNGECTNAGDLSKQDSSEAVTNKPAVIRIDILKTPTQFSTEFDDDDDDDIFNAPTQILSIPNENRDFTELPVSTTKGTTDNIMEVPTQLHCASRDCDGGGGDDIFGAVTQIVEVPARSSKNFTGPSKSFSGENAISDNINTHKKFEVPISKDVFLVESVQRESDTSEILPSKKTIVTPNAQNDDNRSDTVALNTSSSVSEEAEGDIIKKSEMITSNKVVISSGVQKTDSKTSALLQSKTPVDVSVCFQNGGINEDESNTPNTPNSSTQKNHGAKSGMLESKKQFITLDLQKDDNCKIDSEAHDNVAPKAEGHCVNETEMGAITHPAAIQHVSVHDSNKPDLVACDGMLGTKSDAHISDVKTPALAEPKVPEDKTVISEKDYSIKPGTAESEKLETSHRDGDETSEINEIKKPNDNISCGQEYFSGKPAISDSKKPSDIISAQKEGDPKHEVADSKVPGDDKLSIHYNSGDETDPENSFQPNLHKNMLERSCNNKFNTVRKSDVVVTSRETAQSGLKNEAVCTENERNMSLSSTCLRDAMPSCVIRTEDKRESAVVTECVESSVPLQLTKMSTEATGADILCSEEEDTLMKDRGDITPVLTLAAGCNNSDNLLEVPPTKCDSKTAMAEALDASYLKSEESSDQSVDFCSNSVSCPPKVSASLNTSSLSSSLPQDHRTESGEQKQNSDLPESIFPDHSKDGDDSAEIPLVGTKIELDSKSLAADHSSIQKECDPKSHPDINQQTALEHKRPISDDVGIVFDSIEESGNDSLDDSFELIMPSSQDLLRAAKESEAAESPFKPEEVIFSEGEGPPSPTFKIIRHSRFPGKTAKVRKRHNIESKGLDTTVGASRSRHQPDKSFAHVSMISNTAARTSRRKLPCEDFVQTDTPNITPQASKQRKLSDKDSVPNDSKNKSNDMSSRGRARGCPGEVQQIETEDVVNTDKQNGDKGRKSKIVKGQDKTVALAGFQKETNMKLYLRSSRREMSSQSKAERNEKKEQDFKSEQSDGPREGRRRSKQMVESPEDNDHKEVGKSSRERSVNKKEDAENALVESSRPSRQRKLTWKIQDSLGSDNSQGSVTAGEEKSKSRSRRSLSNRSQNEINENLGLSTSRPVKSGNVSPSKSPSKKLLKSSEDSSSVTSNNIKGNKGTDFILGQQNVSLRKSARQTKGNRTVVYMADLSEKQSPKKVTQQNDTEMLCNKGRKRKTDKTVTETAFICSKKEKSQRSNSDRCSAETNMSVSNTDENLKDICSESNIRASGRRGRQTANVQLVREQHTVVNDIRTVLTETALKNTVDSSTDSVQADTGRSVKKRVTVTDSDLSCLEELNASVSLNASSRPQRGVKRTKPSVEVDAERLSKKQTKSGKRLSQTHSASFESMQSPRTRRTRRKVTSPEKSETAETEKQNATPGQREGTDRISKTGVDAEHLSEKQTKSGKRVSQTHSASFEYVQSPRTRRTRRKVTSPEKSETAETEKQDSTPGQREGTDRISKTGEAYKELKNKFVTPKSPKINLSEDQYTTPKRARSSRGRGTPQSINRLDSQKVSVTLTYVTVSSVCEDRRKNVLVSVFTYCNITCQICH
jgi:hypothetical protein